LTIATCDPQNLSIQDELPTFLDIKSEVVVRDRADCRRRSQNSTTATRFEKLVAELALMRTSAAIAFSIKIDITEAPRCRFGARS